MARVYARDPVRRVSWRLIAGRRVWTEVHTRPTPWTGGFTTDRAVATKACARETADRTKDGLPMWAGYPTWLNPGDNAWQLTAATLVGLMSVPGLVVLYGGVMQKRWSVNSIMM